VSPLAPPAGPARSFRWTGAARAAGAALLAVAAAGATVVVTPSPLAASTASPTARATPVQAGGPTRTTPTTEADDTSTTTRPSRGSDGSDGSGGDGDGGDGDTGSGDEPTTGIGSGRTGPARVVDLSPRAVDLTVRTEATDGSEQSVESPDQRTLTLAADVLFEVDQAYLTGDARQRLAELAEELNTLGGRTVTIEGHTDDQGDTAYNQTLSERRAESVRANLSVQLDDGFTLEVHGYGETRPAVPNTGGDGRPDPEAQARNRRVVVSYPTG
jgi:outer membrane protein OmpA-like peptidoglycan-associated protein